MTPISGPERKPLALVVSADRWASICYAALLLQEGYRARQVPHGSARLPVADETPPEVVVLVDPPSSAVVDEVNRQLSEVSLVLRVPVHVNHAALEDLKGRLPVEGCSSDSRRCRE